MQQPNVVPSPQPRSRKRQRLRDFWEIIVLCIGAGTLLALTHYAVAAPVRLTIGLLMGGIGSGYSITLAIFWHHDLKTEERFGLSLIFSIAVLIIAALVMSDLHIPITARALMITVATVVLMASVITLVKRRKTNYRSTSVPNARMPLFALLVATSVAAVTWITVAPSLGHRSLAFFVTTQTNLQNLYPYHVTLGTRYRIKLHVTQGTAKPLHYKLVVQNNGHDLTHKSITAHGSWSQSITIPSNMLGAHRLTFLLFAKGHAAKPLRELWLYYRVVNKPGANP